MTRFRKFVLIIAIAFVLGGCATTKGLAEDTRSLPGAIQAFADMIMKTDQWIKENLW